MIQPQAELPRVFLNRAQWLRLVVVGLLVAFALGRVAPDAVRAVYPLHVFGYLTDGDGVVVSEQPQPHHTSLNRQQTAAPAAGRHGKTKAQARAPAQAHPDNVALGDRVRIDRIAPFDRKPGLAGAGFTYDNPDRSLPVERSRHVRTLHLQAHDESVPSRTFAVLGIVLYVISVGFGAILFLIKPAITTAAFFVFCLGGEAPTTYLDLAIPNPWRPIPEWLGNTLRGAARPALLLFAFCLIDGDKDAPRERIFAGVCSVVGLLLGSVNAYAAWLLTYAGRPAGAIDRFSTEASSALTAFTTLAFVVAFVRARGIDRRRIAWIVIAFLFAAAARLISDQFFPRYIAPWVNGLLVSATIVPIVGVWVAVIRQRFFNVDFVVSRAIVYVAFTAAAVGTIAIAEELGTYIFYNNSDLWYGFFMLISLVVGATTGRLSALVHRLVDRFIFRDRGDQRRALELIEGYILDAETLDDVYRALLADAAHALKLSFGGFMMRLPNGDYQLSYQHDWPVDCITVLTSSDELTLALTRTRGALTFTGKDTALIGRAFPGERLTFAAPIFFDRTVLGIVVYGHNVSGLDLDPDEREHLVRVVAHASIALSSIELARYRAGAAYEAPVALQVRTV